MKKMLALVPVAFYTNGGLNIMTKTELESELHKSIEDKILWADRVMVRQLTILAPYTGEIEYIQITAVRNNGRCGYVSISPQALDALTPEDTSVIVDDLNRALEYDIREP
jgi:hypothetical protein